MSSNISNTSLWNVATSSGGQTTTATDNVTQVYQYLLANTDVADQGTLTTAYNTYSQNPTQTNLTAFDAAVTAISAKYQGLGITPSTATPPSTLPSPAQIMSQASQTTTSSLQAEQNEASYIYLTVSNKVASGDSNLPALQSAYAALQNLPANASSATVTTAVNNFNSALSSLEKANPTLTSAIAATLSLIVPTDSSAIALVTAKLQVNSLLTATENQNALVGTNAGRTALENALKAFPSSFPIPLTQSQITTINSNITTINNALKPCTTISANAGVTSIALLPNIAASATTTTTAAAAGSAIPGTASTSQFPNVAEAITTQTLTFLVNAQILPASAITPAGAQQLLNSGQSLNSMQQYVLKQIASLTDPSSTNSVAALSSYLTQLQGVATNIVSYFTSQGDTGISADTGLLSETQSALSLISTVQNDYNNTTPAAQKNYGQSLASIVNTLIGTINAVAGSTINESAQFEGYLAAACQSQSSLLASYKLPVATPTTTTAPTPTPPPTPTPTPANLSDSVTAATTVGADGKTCNLPNVILYIMLTPGFQVSQATVLAFQNDTYSKSYTLGNFNTELTTLIQQNPTLSIMLKTDPAYINATTGSTISPDAASIINVISSTI